MNYQDSMHSMEGGQVDLPKKQEINHWERLKKLAGYYQDSSDETITMFQDDATRTYHIKVGKESNYGNCFEEALNKFYLKEDL